jgi:hypothetical protein
MWPRSQIEINGMERDEIKAPVVFFTHYHKAVPEENHLSFTQDKWAPN